MDWFIGFLLLASIWLLAAGCWLLAAGCWLLAARGDVAIKRRRKAKTDAPKDTGKKPSASLTETLAENRASARSAVTSREWKKKASRVRHRERSANLALLKFRGRTNESSLGERIRRERKQKGLSQTVFGELASVTKRSQILYEGGQRVPRADYLVSLEAMGVDLYYVLTGRKSSGGSSDVQAPVEEPLDGYSPVPMYDIEAAAGAGRLIEHKNIESTLYFQTQALSAEGLDPAHLVGAKVRGDSMGSTL